MTIPKQQRKILKTLKQLRISQIKHIERMADPLRKDVKMNEGVVLGKQNIKNYIKHSMIVSKYVKRLIK